MDDKTNDTTTGGSAADESFAWSAEPEATANGSSPAREWLNQLQTMIENLATQAAPVIRDIGAKAAELAATAGDKAGPVAQRAAELTGQAGQKLAERSRDFAADLRRDQAASDAASEADKATESTPAGVA